MLNFLNIVQSFPQSNYEVQALNSTNRILSIISCLHTKWLIKGRNHGHILRHSTLFQRFTCVLSNYALYLRHSTYVICKIIWTERTSSLNLEDIYSRAVLQGFAYNVVLFGTKEWFPTIKIKYSCMINISPCLSSSFTLGLLKIIS